MKKVISGVLATVIALSAVTASAFAACHRTGRNYIDANGDGICDYASSHCVYAGGVRDYCAPSHARGHGFHGGCHGA